MYIRISIFIVLITGLFALVFLSNKRNETGRNVTSGPQRTTNALGKEVPLVNIRPTHGNDVPSGAIMNIDTPEVKIFTDTVAADRANAFIKRFLEDEQKNFLARLSRMREPRSATSSTLNVLTITTTTLLDTPRILTFRLSVSTMLSELPHPEKVFKYISLDLEKNTPIHTKDLFRSEAEWNSTAELFSRVNSAQISTSTSAILLAMKTEEGVALGRDGLHLALPDDSEMSSSSSSNTSGKELILPSSQVSALLSKDTQDMMLLEESNIRMSEPEEQNIVSFK